MGGDLCFICWDKQLFNMCGQRTDNRLDLHERPEDRGFDKAINGWMKRGDCGSPTAPHKQRVWWTTVSGWQEQCKLYNSLLKHYACLSSEGYWLCRQQCGLCLQYQAQEAFGVSEKPVRCNKKLVSLSHRLMGTSFAMKTSLKLRVKSSSTVANGYSHSTASATWRNTANEIFHSGKSVCVRCWSYGHTVFMVGV